MRRQRQLTAAELGQCRLAAGADDEDLLLAPFASRARHGGLKDSSRRYLFLLLAKPAFVANNGP